MNQKPLIVWVTGGSRGIGKAICSTLAQAGMTVIFNYSHDEVAAGKTVNEIRKNNGKIEALKGSVTDEQEMNSLCHYIIEKYGRLDVLVNNAGITRDGLLFMMKEENWDDVIDTNLVGTLLTTSAALKPMVKNGFGRIINISSISGLIGTAGQTNYSTSKAAIHGFTRSLAREIAPYNVTINSIAAGYVETEMIETIKKEKLEEIKSQIPLKRFASTLEIAQNVQFLISDAAAYMTGQVLPIDGGLSII